MNNVYVWIPRLVIAALGLSLNVAHAEEVVAVIVNPTYQGEVSSGMVRGIYLGENRSLIPVAQAKGSFDRQVFLDGVVKMNELSFKRHWSKLIFSGKKEQRFSQGVSFGYLVGVVDSIRRNKHLFPEAHSPDPDHNDVCFPTGVTAGQLEKVWIKWANDNPEYLQYEASNLVLIAFAEAWPCP